LKRGTLATLIARREGGGLLVAASKLVTTLTEQAGLFRRVLDLDYSDARRHMKLWVHWPRVAKMLRDREESCHKRGIPFIVPGYRRCLRLAEITGRMGPAIPTDPPPPFVERDPLPTDVAVLMEMVERLEQQNRLERAKSIKLTSELDMAKDELNELRTERQVTSPTGWFSNLAGWIGSKLPKIKPVARPSEVEVRIGNCLDLIDPGENVHDAIVTDPPYQISLHGYDWDRTNISFSAELWAHLFRVLKPGGYVAFFTAPRRYHRAAIACEDAGFTLYPFLGWRFRDGLPKPVNLSELFDRDNLAEREVIGTRRGSGFTIANVDHGAQNRTHTDFAAHARHVSQEAQNWRGYFYGVNTLKPCMEPILLAQKPIRADSDHVAVYPA
jgi:hypothetical protein